MSLVSRTFTEVGNALKDAYGHVFHGDDAGTHETKVVILSPKKVKVDGIITQKFDIGMTFLNVNDRAFVKAVEPGSDADIDGIQAQDCLQLAIVLGGNSKLDRMQTDKRRAILFGLQCEKQGRRTSFDELKEMFVNCSLNVDNAGVEMFDSSEDTNRDPKNIPLSRRIRSTTQEMVGRCAGVTVNKLAIDMPSNSSGRAEYPVILVFRHTHKRYAGSSPHVAMPYFRLDDECERAALIVRRLAPTADSKADPDAWDEIMENAQKFFSPNAKKEEDKSHDDIKEKDVEAETIRGMIQSALGLAFVRTSKVVLGVSLHFGSGIVISRLEDGTWSAPSAIGLYGAGLGVQFGLEVADYIFILQTEEALNHFRRGTNYTIGGNMGVAVGGMGREAYGAASLGMQSKEGQPRQAQVSPIVAYAKSQGLYFGVSLEGSKIYAREDINQRAYKFATGQDISTDDILSGRVPAPREAEDLYATLHSVEFAHEKVNIPKPPYLLLDDLSNDWFHYKSTLAKGKDKSKKFYWVSTLPTAEAQEFSSFETVFKNFMYGGVSVQRISPRQEYGGNAESLERRTLWLMLPEVGSLRLGYVSKHSTDGNDDQSEFSDGQSHFTDDHTTAESMADDFTIDSKSTYNSARRRKRIKLSKKYSSTLTDIVSLKRASTNAGNPNDDKREMRLIEIFDKHGKVLLFITNTVREAELLSCGLKLLLERETTRIGERGGISLEKLGGIAPLTPPRRDATVKSVVSTRSENTSLNQSRSGDNELSELSTDCSSSENENDVDSIHDSKVPEGRQSWSQVPGRQHLRKEASMVHAIVHDNNLPSPQRNPVQYEGYTYSHGEQLHTEIATNAMILLPLPLCRALFLDSSSPLIKRWEIERGDGNYSKSQWNLPSSSHRHGNSKLSENELLSGGSMQGAHRTILFDRMRNGQIIRLSETVVIVRDDNESLSLTISERMPRRGFSIKARITLLKESKQHCSVSVFGGIVPMGKDLSNVGAVHRAFLLVVDELEGRYGTENQGLLAVLFSVVKAFPSQETGNETSFERSFNTPQVKIEAKEESASRGHKPKLEDRGIASEKQSALKTIGNSSTDWQFDSAGTNVQFEPMQTPREEHVKIKKARESPPTSSVGRNIDDRAHNSQHWATSDFDDWENAVSNKPKEASPSNSNVTIDVKPLPKLRLDLMPAPREEDEDNISTI